ncbi:DUF6998 domain-containing protein [Rhizobium leguminosarum]|uniref:DUF6998 domain-containing protein n=1 Tax=Rhizobium leguminosarum TaxID=384 RepID=UPI0035E42C16
MANAVPGLSFTFDAKLVGDIGEAVAAELFRLTLKPGGGWCRRSCHMTRNPWTPSAVGTSESESEKGAPDQGQTPFSC